MLITALVFGAAAVGSIGAITMAASKDKKNNVIQPQQLHPINVGDHNGDVKIVLGNDNSDNRRDYVDTVNENKLKEDIIKDIRNIFKEEKEINMQDYIDDIDMILAKYK